MLHTPFLISIVIIGLMTDTETQSRDDVRLCLLQAMFYYPPSGECHEPLEQGPCDQAQWLVPALRDKMVLQCQQRPQTPNSGFILKSDGSVVEDRGVCVCGCVMPFVCRLWCVWCGVVWCRGVKAC